MKKFNLTPMLASILVIGSCLASGSVMAIVPPEVSVTTGTACKAYSPSTKTRLKSDWNTIRSSADVWVHCPDSQYKVESLEGGLITFNLEIPVDAQKDIFNCYIATQNSNADSSTKTVIWKLGSSAGVTAVEIKVEDIDDGGDDNGGESVGFRLADEIKTLTGGCHLYAGQKLHSVAYIKPD